MAVGPNFPPLDSPLLTIKQVLHFTWDAIVRVRPEGECAKSSCPRLSVVDCGAVLVLLGVLSGLSLISRVVCLFTLYEFPLLHYHSACSAVPFPIWYIDAMTAFP